MDNKVLQPVESGEETLKDDSPTISIVIPNYNGQRHLETCLASLAELDYSKDRLEIIVVDNASTDDSVAWIKQEHPEIHLLVNPTNLGFAAGANRGAEIASGSCLAFLNPDMRVDKEWLKALVRAMSSEPNVACAGSVVLNWTGDKIDFAGRPEDALNLCFKPPEDASTIVESADDVPMLFASGGAMLVQRDVFLKVGGFDEDYFLYHEDVDFGWRLWLAGYRVLRSSRSFVFHRGGASSQHLPPEYVMCQAQRNTLYTLIKNLGDDQMWPALPGVLWFLVNRSRWSTSVKLSLGQAINELIQVMESVWQKRLATQASRIRTDEAIFAICGHPLGFLSTLPGHSEFQAYLMNTDILLLRPVADISALSNRIIHLLYYAYKFNYEQLLVQMEEKEELATIITSSRSWVLLQTLRHPRIWFTPCRTWRGQILRLWMRRR